MVSRTDQRIGPLKMARRDYFYDPEAPKPNSIRPATAVALFNSAGELLLLHRRDNHKWTMPGGTLDFGESLTQCAIREVHEETGLRIRITGLIGTYTDPHILIAYSDGEVPAGIHIRIRRRDRIRRAEN